jgi:hypothetical protein
MPRAPRQKPEEGAEPKRFQGRNFFFTYAQAGAIESKNALLSFLLATPHAKNAIVSKEDHKDGTPHYHAYVHYDRKKDVGPRHWDFQGVHPNIQSTRDIKAVVTYIVKDGDFEHSPGFDLNKYKEKPDVFTTMKEVIAKQETEKKTNDDVLREIIDITGTGGLRMWFQISGYVDRLCQPRMLHQPRWNYPEDFIIQDEQLTRLLQRFIIDCDPVDPETGNLKGRDGRHSLWIHGPTKMGKSDLACSLGPHWYMGENWNLACWDSRADYGVLDDISWESLKLGYKGLLGLQPLPSFTDKYSKKKQIRHGKPVIVLTNSLPLFTVEEAEWLAGNVKFYELKHKVYIPREE